MSQMNDSEPSPAPKLNPPRSIKTRRTTSAMEAIRSEIKAVLAEDNPMTVRQVFYQLVSRGAVGKTENEYKHTVGRLLTEMRRNGSIAFDTIADNTRWMRKPTTHSSLQGMLSESRKLYRRALWNDQEVYCEVWLEKDALAGVLLPETAEFDVPLMVTRGYPSVSYLYEAGSAIAAAGKPTYIYYFGDHDPSGRDITRATEAGLREHAPDAEIYFERVAVTEMQIELLKLPTRPTKLTDSRSKNFTGDSVEVDAIPPGLLRGLVRSCIEHHIDKDALQRTKLVEQQERQTLENIYKHMSGAQ
jgi:hypothetical protein